MEEALKETMLAQFRAYLDQVGTGVEASADAPEEGRTVDLFALFSELVALKSEVRLEARQFKTSLDQFREAFGTVQSSHAVLQAEVERGRAERQTVQREAQRPLLLDLLDLRDRLEAGLPSLGKRGRWWCKGQDKLLATLREGQEITLRRLDRVLEARRVRPIEALGRSLDPHTMRATAVESRRELADGVVTAELRKGFLWEGEVLRPAEVKVNRTTESL
jgi:molecular chaperone GrpE